MEYNNIDQLNQIKRSIK